jgi:phosphoglycerol transferase MdoB-like AlkP superfamily enzyme
MESDCSVHHKDAMARFRVAILLGAGYLMLGVVTRGVMWAAFGREAQVTGTSLLWVVPAGLLADSVQFLYLITPIIIYLWLKGFSGPRKVFGKATLFSLIYFWILGVLFITACEYFFFEEFNSRFNLVSVNYLIYPTEVAGDIWSEYPIVKVLVGCGILAGISAWGLRRHISRALSQPCSFRLRSRLMVPYGILMLLAIGWFPTNLLGLGSNRVANELAANGPSSFFRALRTSEIDYHAYYATRPQAENLKTMVGHQLSRGDGEFTRLAESRLDRHFPPRADGLGKLNVILISSESFGAEFSKLYGSTRDWTPEFDRFAQQGLWFRHVYATGTRTVRGLEAISASIPPIPTESILRRPGNESIATLAKVLRGHGYQASFIYGGYGYFDNMNYFFSNNGYDVLDRTNLNGKPRFENIWGVSDEDLFDPDLFLPSSRAPTPQN